MKVSKWGKGTYAKKFKRALAKDGSLAAWF